MNEIDFAALVDEEDLAARRAAVEAIKPLWELREAQRYFKRDEQKLDPSASDRGKMGALRVWLLEHDEPLVDEEAGIRAELRSGGTSTVYDAVGAIRERAPQLFQRLLELGCLRIDEAAVQNAIKGKLLMPADLNGFTREMERTPRLVLEKIR